MPRRLPSGAHDRLGRRAFLGRSVAVAAVSAVPRLAFGQSKQVNVYNWDTYMARPRSMTSPRPLGIAVRYDLFSSNEELFAKLREKNPGYDVIFPSNNSVERMIAAKIIEPLDHAKSQTSTTWRSPSKTRPTIPALRTACPISGGRRASAIASQRPIPADQMGRPAGSDRFKGRIALLE